MNLVNAGSRAIYVGYTKGTQWGKITWVQTQGCTAAGNGLVIAPNTTCAAAAALDNAATRFCAAPLQNAGASLTSPNCALAQIYHWTLVETVFQTAAECGKIPGPCAWYDISVIPANCTDSLWKQNQCNNTGGASYNLPVELSCQGEPTYICRGPTSTLYGPENYPSNCGNPNSYKAVPPVVPQAYFFPMFYSPENMHQPNSVCPGGQILTISFLSGP